MTVPLIIDVSSQLTVLFHLYFSRGVSPLILKVIPVSKFIPIYKKDSKLKCPNYMPISLLSNIDKVLWQTYVQLHKIGEQLYSENFACRIFVDLQKPFDTVDHDIHTQKLNHYGISRTANN